ncbi:hypothetical protein Angca_004239, partial [Angiostrongylus cantonensis]
MGKGSFNEQTVQSWFEKFLHVAFAHKGEGGNGRDSATSDDDLKNLFKEYAYTKFQNHSTELDVNISISTLSEHLKNISKSEKHEKW